MAAASSSSSALAVAPSRRSIDTPLLENVKDAIFETTTTTNALLAQLLAATQQLNAQVAARQDAEALRHAQNVQDHAAVARAIAVSLVLTKGIAEDPDMDEDLRDEWKHNRDEIDALEVRLEQDVNALPPEPPSASE